MLISLLTLTLAFPESADRGVLEFPYANLFCSSPKVAFTFEISSAFLLTCCIYPDTALNLSSTYILLFAPLLPWFGLHLYQFSHLHWHTLRQ